ncbi:unnamed protein product [Closterium sp. NIES-53]
MEAGSRISHLIFAFALLSLLPATILADEDVSQGTLISLYDSKDFRYSEFTAYHAIRPDPRAPCHDLPEELVGRVGSLMITWNTRDHTKRHMMCNTVWFFSESQCAGVATGIELPDGPQHASPRNYSYGFTVKKNVRGPLASVASVGCSYTPNPCSLYGCPAHSVCDSAQGTSHMCLCRKGFIKIKNQCVWAAGLSST